MDTREPKVVKGSCPKVPERPSTSRRRWPNISVKLRASIVSFPASSSYRTALGAVASQWNKTPGKFVYFQHFDDLSIGLGNDQSEVWFAYTDPTTLGVTHSWYDSNCILDETDVIFNNVIVAWTSGTTKSSMTSYGGKLQPFRTTAMHEYGHVQGLAHNPSVYNIMGTSETHIHANGPTATAYPGEDAVHGSIATYGLTTSTFEDLGIAHWRRTGSNNGYSTHSRTRLLDLQNVELARATGVTERTYLVSKGQTVKLELTYENMGRTSSRTVKVGFYVSTDDTITTLDTFLGAGTVTVSRGFPDTISNTFLIIPNTLVSGKNYWLGAIIDYNGSVAEAFENNNATYVGIRVR